MGWRFWRRIGAILLAMSGLRVDRLTWRRILPTLLGVGFYIYMLAKATLPLAIVYFALVFATRYSFLFFSFVHDGIADRLKRRHGEEGGWRIYEAATAQMFLHGGFAFSVLLHATEWLGRSNPSSNALFLDVSGVIFSLAGLVVSVWSTQIVGIDVYYYKDLFLGRFIGEFKEEGPYRWFSNPMYGIGQSAAYGAALSAASIPGVMATMMNQGMMYIFYYTIERPHIMRLLSGTRVRRA